MYSLQTPVSLFLSCSVWAAWSSCVVTLLKSVACPPCHHHQRHTYILPTWEGNEGNQPLKRCTFCKPMAKHSHWAIRIDTIASSCMFLWIQRQLLRGSAIASMENESTHNPPPPPENWKPTAGSMKMIGKMWKWVSFFIWRWISDSSR